MLDLFVWIMILHVHLSKSRNKKDPTNNNIIKLSPMSQGLNMSIKEGG